MINPRDVIFSQALNLSSEDRSLLLDRLLQSLNEEVDPAIEKAWAMEIERRIDSHDRGEINSISAEEVMKRLGDRKIA